MGQFDVARFGALLDQRRSGHTLPQALYTEMASFAFDMEAIFRRSWLMVGMECELAAKDGYVASMIGNWPIIVTRDRAGDIRAFHNSCRHRGSILCNPGRGTAPKLVCPYHRWTYNLDGTLFAAMRMPEGFDRAAHGLRPIAVRRAGGAIFICLSDDPPPFEDFGDVFQDYAAPLNFANLKLAATDLMIEQANWKLVMENARECYHCPTGHPELATSFPVHMKRHFEPRDASREAKFAAEMDAAGLPHAPREGDWWQIARFSLNDGSSSITMDGQPIVKKALLDANGGNAGSLRWAIDPHLFAHATADHLFVFSCMPVSATETHVLSKWFVHKDAEEGVDYDVPALKELWVKTNQQDRELAENNHRGILSPGYMPGPYSLEAESMAQRFTDWYCTQARAYVDANVI